MSGAEPGVDRLIEHIVEKAREQARDIVRKAEDEARRLLEEALAKKHALVEEERRRAEIEARWRREAILSEARRRASMLLVASASRVLNEIEERAWRLLDNLSPETRRASLRVLAAEALALIRDQRGRLESKHLTMVVSARDYDSAVEIARELERD
ncbi:MAG: V-type ATP synthase subunit E family protein, partial [Acidilobaceae archaeon]